MSGYDIAVKISLIENVTRGLTAMSGAFARTSADAKKLEETMARIGKMTLMGGVLLGAGAMGLKGLDATVEAASKYQKAVADFKTLNLSAHEVAEVEAKAAENAHKVLGSTLTENVKTVQDLHTAFGDLHHALDMSGDFTKFETVMKQSLGEGKANGLVLAAAKALEHRGDKVLQNPENFQDELARMSKVSMATKGVVTSKDFLQASNTGKMAYTLLDKDYLYGKGAAMMTMNGGDKYGTMLMTAFSSLIGGHMDKKAKGFLADIDMFEEGVSAKRMKSIKESMKGMSGQEKQIFMQQLGGESMMAGGLKAEYVDLMKSPDKLVAVMAEKIRDRYGKDLNNEQVAEVMAKNFNRNTGMFLGEHVLNAGKLEKDAAVFGKSMDYNQGYDNYMGTNEGQKQAMHAQWENLKTVLGQSLLPVVQSLTAGITSLVASMTSFAQAHPTITKFIMILLAMLAVIAVIAGVILLATAAFTAFGMVIGLISLPVLAFVALLVLLVGVLYAVKQAWDNADIKGFWQRIGQQIVAVWNSLKASASAIWNSIKSALVNAWNNLKSSATAIWNSIKSSLVAVWNGIKAVATSVWNGIKNTLVTVWNSIRSSAVPVWNSIRSALINAWNAIRSAALAVWNAIKAVIIAAWNAIKSVISGAMTSAQGIVNSGFSAIVSAISSWISKAVAAVQGALGAVGGMLSGIGAKVSNFFHGGSGINTIAKGGTSQTHVSFKVDGRTLAQGVVHHMNASAYRGAGGRSFDGSRGRVMA